MFITNVLLNELTESEKPSKYFDFLRNENHIGNFPELNALIGCIQEPLWHPEGDVWTHTLLVIDVAAGLKDFFRAKSEKTAFMLGALCHDFGKPYTNNYENSKIRSLMHDQYGILPACKFLKRLNTDEEINNKVLNYVEKHLIPMQLYKNQKNVSVKAIIKLENQIHIPELVQLSRADHWGRTDEDSRLRICEPADWLMAKYNEIFLNKK